MPNAPLLAAYLILTGLSHKALTLLPALLDHSSPQLRFVVVTVGVGAGVVAYALRGRSTRLCRRRVKHSRVSLLRG